MRLLKYALLVFLGACSYGSLSTIIKLGMKDGFSMQQLVGSQYFFGWVMLLLLVLLFSRKRLGMKLGLSLLVAGITISLTGIFYGFAVEELPASIAIVLLFQFTWIGVILEAIVDRKFPSREKCISMLILLIGTILAGGILEPSVGGITAKGVIFGLMSAVSFAFYIFVSGRVATQVPAVNKSLYMTTSALIIILMVFSPSFIYDGAIPDGLWKFGLPLGLLGIVIPVLFFSIGVPKLGSGLGAILGAAELPAAVVASVLILHEEVSLLRWVGIIVVLLGIATPQLLPIWIRKKSTTPLLPKVEEL
ncbi:EamA family transporter [Paenibacillus glucanolyticus]|uniref:EamA family transporter n=1 Tax=Paenibacillus glucanolyticus TaxID=59843 RepID=UPI00128CA668|nr:DMT family transporter [Paenibacillus glucanolyticus]MPY18905.1 EamA family transporter [Paenibacillus glucanolyticus]